LACSLVGDIRVLGRLPDVDVVTVANKTTNTRPALQSRQVSTRPGQLQTPERRELGEHRPGVPLSAHRLSVPRLGSRRCVRIRIWTDGEGLELAFVFHGGGKYAV
jgi:hypothetical protein